MFTARGNTSLRARAPGRYNSRRVPLFAVARIFVEREFGMVLPGNPPADVLALRARRRRGAAVGVRELVGGAVFAAIGTATPVLCRVVHQRLPPLFGVRAGRDDSGRGTRTSRTGPAPRTLQLVGTGPAWRRTRCQASSHRLTTVLLMATCPGGLILHADGTVAACTLDEDEDGCRGRDLRHEGDPIRCWVWTLGGCNHCGVH